MQGREFVHWLNDKPIEEIKNYVQSIEGHIEELKKDAKYFAEQQDAQSMQIIMEDIEDYRKMYRIGRSYYDTLYFAYEYFSHDRNPENDNNLIPEGVGIEDAPYFHIELTEMLDKLNEEPTKKIGWGAPRGHAKSAYLTNIFPTHQIVFEKRKYIMIISETSSMSEAFLEFVSNNLKENEKLIKDFGTILSLNPKENRQDNSSAFITQTNIKLQASSMGSRIRGARFNNARPDLILCDDLESAQNTNTEDLREKNLHWFNSVVVPIGEPYKTSIIYMGTLVHGQGLLPNILNRPEYQSKIYSSIVNEPDNIHLWHQVEDILKDVTNENRLEEAEAFYKKHRAEMDAGAEVLWADRFTYFDLVKKKVEVGSRAFASEYLNLPSDSETAIFKEEFFNEYDIDNLIDSRNGRLKKGYEVVGFWDIAMGKNKRSDYNAVVMIARHLKTGMIYVLDAWAEKCSPSKAMDKAIDLIQRWQPKKFGVETISAQFEFYRQMQNRLNREGIYFTRLVPENPSAKKEERIESLEPLFEQGLIRTTERQRLLTDMLIQYPAHQHDDLPDALASALGLIRLNRKRAYYSKPQGL